MDRTARLLSSAGKETLHARRQLLPGCLVRGVDATTWSCVEDLLAEHKDGGHELIRVHVCAPDHGGERRLGSVPLPRHTDLDEAPVEVPVNRKLHHDSFIGDQVWFGGCSPGTFP